MKNRLLAWLLALCLMTSIPVGALAEEAASAPVEEEVFESETVHIGAEESTGGELTEASNDLAESGEAPAPQGPRAIAEDEAFVEGLAVVFTAENALWDDAGDLWFENLPVGCVLYAARRYGTEQIQVGFDCDGALAWGWMAPEALRPATDAEASDAIAAAKADPAALWLEEVFPLTSLGGAEVVSDDAASVPEGTSDPEGSISKSAEGSTSRRISAETAALMAGERLTLWVEGADEAPIWSVDDESVASISQEGLLTALNPGNTTAAATFSDGERLTCAVTVLSSGLESIAFASDTLTLGVKESSAALSVILDQNGQPVDVAVSYATEKSKYVSVTGDGMIKGLKKGSSRITARTADGLTATCLVTVLKAPSKVTVSPALLTLGVGQVGQVSYALSAKSAGAVAWSSSNPGVAAVDPLTGAVEALSKGTATLTARAFNNKNKSLKVTVLDAPERVSFDSEAFSIGEGQTVTLNARPNEGAFGEMTYASSDERVAAVSGDRLTGLREGTATITATAYNGVTADCEVTVQPAPEYVTLPFTEVIMGLKDELQLAPDAGGATSQFDYQSSKPKVVSVTGNGLMRALKKGTAYVTVKTYNNKSFKIKVSVKAAPTSVTAVPKTLTLDVGATAVVGYQLPKNKGGIVTFSSSDESVVTVDPQTGEVTARGSGEADVILRTYNNRTDRCHVQVIGAPAAIELEEDDFDIAVGQSVQLVPLFPDGGHALVMYESMNPGIVDLAGDGIATGVAPGNAVVYVYAGSQDVYTTAAFRVWDAPSEVHLAETAKSMMVNDTLTLNPIIPSGSRTTFTYESNDENVARVDENGLVKTVGGGEAVITVTTHNGMKATILLTVLDPWYPEALTLLEEVPELTEGDTWQVRWAVEPEQSAPNLEWTSSKKAVATVDADGLITAVSSGEATIKAVSRKNPSLTLTIPVTVVGDSGDLVTEIPARTTDEDGIERNLAKIDAVRKSAISEIDRLRSNGTISSSDADKRRSMVNNIFKNYAFPWKTKKLQKYWKAANSEGGVKDFKTDRVYYGLPYISGSGNNRHYDVELALDENRYYDSGEGYYILNQNKLLGGKYVGNDCSGLVNVSIWGTSSKRASDRTDDIASSKYYRTISDFTAMRPGDLICKSSAHVVMFLYYVNAEKTKFMMIENGGAEAGTNTVHCDIYDASYYKSRSYRVRRLATLD